jgi:Ion channel
MKNWISNNEFLALLLALLAFLFLPSFIMDEKAKDITIYTLLLIVLAVGVFELSGNRNRFLVGTSLAFLAFVLNSWNFSNNVNLVFLFRMISLLAFFMMLTAFVMYRMSVSRKITLNIVYCAINGYILLGMIGGLLFRMVHHFYKNSFFFEDGLQPKIDDFTYFSFITLSTLGYGDITPISAPGKALAIFLSISGPLYLAIVVGVIVGKFIFYLATKDRI